MPRLKGFRYLREIIAYAVWTYFRFALSTADVEDLLAERGIVASGETVRLWVNRFGTQFADCIKRDRPGPADKLHLDEAVLPIGGQKFWRRVSQLTVQQEAITSIDCSASVVEWSAVRPLPWLLSWL